MESGVKRNSWMRERLSVQGHVAPGKSNINHWHRVILQGRCANKHNATGSLNCPDTLLGDLGSSERLDSRSKFERL